MRFGQVSVSRRRSGCDDCGYSELAFDKRWALPAGDYADDVREAIERLSCRLGYQEAVQELKALWGVAPDASTAQRWVQQDGDRAKQAVQADADQHWEQYVTEQHAVAEGERQPAARTPGFGVVEMDGVQVLTWKPGKEPRRGKKQTVATDNNVEGCCAVGESKSVTTESSTCIPVSEPNERSLRHQPPSTLSEVSGSPMGPTGRSPRVQGRELCVGLVYLEEHACQQSPGHGVLLERRYVITLEDRDGFWQQLHAAATTQGVLDRQHVVRLSDGGKWFIDQSAELFCDQPLVGILDIQHAKQHVWETGHKVVPDKKQVATWVAPHIQSLKEGRAEQVVIDLAQERERRSGAEQKKALDALSGYIDRHKHLMDYPTYREAGYPVSSAAIESANKRLVGRRCKQGSMIWSVRGLEAIVALRVAFYNPGAWPRLWPLAAAA
jgi:hypothetical protein